MYIYIYVCNHPGYQVIQVMVPFLVSQVIGVLSTDLTTSKTDDHEVFLGIRSVVPWVEIRSTRDVSEPKFGLL